MDFTVSSIELEAADGTLVKVADGPIEISSEAVASGQIFLKDAPVEPGSYRGFKINVAAAFVNGKGGRVSLALPEPGGGVTVKADINLQRGESYAVSFAWAPDRSIEKSYRFQPALEAEGQAMSSRGLLLFVSNSGSNYISIIDRSLERVIGAVTVGDRPTGMALNSTQDLLYVLNSDSRSISVVETSRFHVLDTIPLQAGLMPVDIVFMPDSATSIDGKLYIANRLTNDVTVVGTSARRMLKSIPVGVYPCAIAADTARREVYVANERSNSLSIISAIDDTVQAAVAVDNKPVGIIAGKDRLYILNEGSNTITLVSPSLRKAVGTVSLADPPGRGVHGFSGRTFIANTSAGTVSFLTPFDVVTRTVPAGPGPAGIAGDEKRNRLYVANYGDDTVTIIDPIGEKVLKRLVAGKKPYSVVLLDR